MKKGLLIVSVCLIILIIALFFFSFSLTGNLIKVSKINFDKTKYIYLKRTTPIADTGESLTVIALNDNVAIVNIGLEQKEITNGSSEIIGDFEVKYLKRFKKYAKLLVTEAPYVGPIVLRQEGAEKPVASKKREGIYVTDYDNDRRIYTGSNWDCIERVIRNERYAETTPGGAGLPLCMNYISGGDSNVGGKNSGCVLVKNHDCTGENEWIIFEVKHFSEFRSSSKLKQNKGMINYVFSDGWEYKPRESSYFEYKP